MTECSPMLPAERSRSAALAFAFVRGAIAAGLGLGSLAVLVMVLWISSPYPDSGPGEALHVATGLWLLAHGAELVRADTLSGNPAPVATVPLLLVVLPVWLAHRAGRDSAEQEEDSAAKHSALGAFCAVTAGYLLVALAAAAYARGGGLPAERTSLAFPLAAVVAGAAAAGVWAACGRPVGALMVWAPLRLQEAVARDRFRAGTQAVLRSAAAGVTVLLGGGAVLVAVALVVHGAEARESYLALSGHWAGRVAIVLLALVLVPNAAMWGAAYGLGPGFALGTASTVTPLVFAGHPALPDFPLLAAVPSPGPGTAANWAAVVVPVAAALMVARFIARGAAPDDGAREDAWTPQGTALAAGLGAVGCGAGAAVLAAASGGPMGTGALAEFGPVWWLVGPAALVWTAVIGVPAALLLRFWRLRERRWGWRRDQVERAEERAKERADGKGGEKPTGKGGGDDVEAARPAGSESYEFLSADPWHEDDARKARWAALRKSSGGLMADFSAVPGALAPWVTGDPLAPSVTGDPLAPSVTGDALAPSVTGDGKPEGRAPDAQGHPEPGREAAS
ncbi:DUF6350 family protein [Streptomyces sp. NPDC060035]|uniref:cell division protein PerM n=1 Tax=Streptomyces sp. NPDC060035 TaxID=3347044 RepID=UPI0036C4FD94